MFTAALFTIAKIMEATEVSMDGLMNKDVFIYIYVCMYVCMYVYIYFSSVTQLCPTLCDPMDCSMPGLPVDHQLPELPQIHVH